MKKVLIALMVTAVAVFGSVMSATATPAVKATPAVRQICRQVVKTYNILYLWDWRHQNGQSTPLTTPFRGLDLLVVNTEGVLANESVKLGKPWGTKFAEPGDDLGDFGNLDPFTDQHFIPLNTVSLVFAGYVGSCKAYGDPIRLSQPKFAIEKKAAAVRRICHQVVMTYDILYLWVVANNADEHFDVIGAGDWPNWEPRPALTLRAMGAVGVLWDESYKLGPPWGSEWQNYRTDWNTLGVVGDPELNPVGAADALSAWTENDGAPILYLIPLRNVRGGFAGYVGSCRGRGDPIRLSPPKITAA
jgi:hypothetical protein